MQGKWHCTCLGSLTKLGLGEAQVLLRRNSGDLNHRCFFFFQFAQTSIVIPVRAISLSRSHFHETVPRLPPTMSALKRHRFADQNPNLRSVVIGRAETSWHPTHFYSAPPIEVVISIAISLHRSQIVSRNSWQPAHHPDIWVLRAKSISL